MNPPILCEVLVDSVESALIAQTAGADRLELCADVVEGGTTPSNGMIQVIREKVSIPIHVMIRPRGGDFCYSEAEFEIMKRDIDIAKSLGANGLVFGIITADGQIDRERNRILIELARPLSVTFHRAIDMTPDPLRALDDLIALTIDRALTSGQKQTAEQGIHTIAEMVNHARGKIIIMAGSGINPNNAKKILHETGVKEIHFSARKQSDSPMHYRKLDLSMGGVGDIPEYSRTYADADMIRAIMGSIFD